MNGTKIGFALCGSYCTFDKVFAQIVEIKSLGADIYPIFSETAYRTDTRFGKASYWVERIEEVCGRQAWHSICDVEPIGPKALLDILLVAPCTGNTLGKLAAGITDGCVTMACKSHLRNSRSVVIAISTNDGLSGSAKSIGELLNRKNIFFVPYGQDDPFNKGRSLVADMTKIPQTLIKAFAGEQLQPIIIG